MILAKHPSRETNYFPNSFPRIVLTQQILLTKPTKSIQIDLMRTRMPSIRFLLVLTHHITNLQRSHRSDSSWDSSQQWSMVMRVAGVRSLVRLLIQSMSFPSFSFTASFSFILFLFLLHISHPLSIFYVLFLSFFSFLIFRSLFFPFILSFSFEPKKEKINMK